MTMAHVQTGTGRSAALFVPGPDGLADPRILRRQAVERRRTARDLRQAVEAGEFTLSLSARRALDGSALRGAEASIRWPRRKLGLAPPGSLVPLLEKYGLMLPTTAWMLEAACEEARLWPGDRGLSVSLDVPIGMVCNGSLAGLVASALARSGLSPGRIEIELPEDELQASGDDALLSLCALRDLGVGVALDHFGSVSGSLLTLKRLPLTALKLDRALIRDLPHDRDAAAACETIIRFAHALEMRVAAIGVDTKAQCDTLRRLGCDEGQGGFFGGQLLPEAFEEFCARKH